MYRAKTAIALKFSPILNMGAAVRDIGLPYLEFGEAKVEHTGRANEMVTLYYSDRRYAIFYNWVQLQFSIGGGEDDLKQANHHRRSTFLGMARVVRFWLSKERHNVEAPHVESGQSSGR